MDRITTIRTMSLRRLVAWAVALACLSALLVLAAVAWALRGGGDTDDVEWALGAGAVILVVVFIALGVQLDHLIAVREADKDALPARPELYDFDKLNPPMHIEEMGGRRLKDLTFVVFDTETTGLRPTKGDLIIQVGGIRIEKGRLREDAAFDRLVNPGRAIPKDSIRYHGITDDMVADQPGIAEVLRAFKDFIGDAVLVAHNAAFDMKFLKMQEEATGVRFDNLVLDTLLLSVFLDAENRDHSLDAIARRLGIDIAGRHTALGDSVATAKVFLRLLAMLEDRGVVTLRHAVDASVKMEHVRSVQKKAFG